MSTLKLVRETDEAAASRFAEGLRITEALLFASDAPLDEAEIARFLPHAVEVAAVLEALEALYRPRGVQLSRVAGKWMFRTAPDLSHLLRGEGDAPRKLSRAALETLGIIAWHQPVTRAEIEALRGVSTQKGTLDLLLEAGFIRMRGRRRTPGRPVTFGTTEAFLIQFGLDKITDLPGIEEMTGAGLVESAVARGLGLPMPSDDATLGPDEDPLDADPFAVMLEERLNALADEPALDPDGADVAAEPTPSPAGETPDAPA